VVEGFDRRWKRDLTGGGGGRGSACGDWKSRGGGKWLLAEGKCRGEELKLN